MVIFALNFSEIKFSGKNETGNKLYSPNLRNFSKSKILIFAKHFFCVYVKLDS